MVKSILVFIFLFFHSTDGRKSNQTKRRSFGQLPTTLSPIRYRLNIQPYFPADGVEFESEKNFTFDANLTILINCLDESDNITMHMLEIELDKKAIELKEATFQKSIPVSAYVYDNETQQVTFSLNENLESGKNYEFNLKYTGKIDADALAGLYPSRYTENGRTRYLVVTQFEPTDARRVMPSFDEPFYKAAFEVTIIHPSSMVALSNSMEESTQKIGNGWSVTTFEPTVNMSTYLLAMAVCDFRSKSNYTADNKTLFRVWARPSFIDKVDYALAAGPKVLDHYSEFFQVPFPLKKQDMLAIPDFAAGAMENWGLVTYREVALLYDTKVSAPKDRASVAVVIAHELAHQWFGDLVTMAWWDDLWLNEGFATYMEFVGTDVISDGKFGMDRNIVSEALSTALSLDQLSTSHPIFVPVSSPDEINEIFDLISYQKGGSIIRMINYTITNEVLRKGLQIYLTKNGYKNADHNDLWAALTQAVQEQGTTLKDWRQQSLNVTEFMNPWILQMGYPLLTVNRHYGEKQKIATIDQERFVISNRTPDNARPEFLHPPYNFTWYVPIWYQTAESTEVQSTWLEPHKTLTLYTNDDNEWLLVNYERAAYCRVNYDERNWHLLANQLHSDYTKIHIKNRIQLLDDAMDLARADRLSYKIPMDLTLYLVNETDYLPWSAGLEGLGYIESMLESTPGYETYKNYIAALTHSQYQRLGWDDTKESPDEVSVHNLRASMIGFQCWTAVENCTNSAKQLFKKFLTACSGDHTISSNCSPITPNLRSVVYCEGAKDESSTAGWNLLWELHAREEVSLEKQRLMRGLTCIKNKTLIYTLLNEAIKEDSNIIRRQDGASVFAGLSRNEVAHPLLWPFVQKNWGTIQILYSNGMLGLGEILRSGSSKFNTEEKLNMIKKFYHDHESQLRTAKRSFQQTMEVVEYNVQWMKKNGEIIIGWLKEQPLPIPTRKRSSPSGGSAVPDSTD